MKKTLFLWICLTFVVTAFSQTNNPQWSTFRSERLGFSLDYPDMWDLSEGMFNNYIFSNTTKPYGIFSVKVGDPFVDSAAAAGYFDLRVRELNDAKVSRAGTYTTLMYKLTIVQNGKNMDIHYWLFVQGNRLYTFSYTVDESLLQNPQVVDEFKSSYGVIETLKFF